MDGVAQEEKWRRDPVGGGGDAGTDGTIIRSTMEVDGRERHYTMYVPPDVADRIAREGLNEVLSDTPVMLATHGTNGTSDSVIGRNWDLRGVADKTGAIVIAPQGLGQNDPDMPAGAGNPAGWHPGADGTDAAFLKAVLPDAEDRLHQTYNDYGPMDHRLGEAGMVGVGHSRGANFMGEIVANPGDYLPDYVNVKGALYSESVQDVTLRDGNAPAPVSGTQQFIFGMQDNQSLEAVLRKDPNAATNWADSLNLNDRQRERFLNLDHEKQAELMLKHPGDVNQDTGRTVVGDMLHDAYRDRIQSVAAAQGVILDDAAIDNGMARTDWGYSVDIRQDSNDGLGHSVHIRADFVDKMGHEWSHSPEEVARTGYDSSARLTEAVNESVNPEPQQAPEAAPVLAAEGPEQRHGNRVFHAQMGM